MNIQEYLKREFKPEDATEYIWPTHVFDSAQKSYKWVWKDPFDDEQYTDDRMWITDIFEPETTQYTEERDRYPKFAPKRPNRSSREEELRVGDTSQLDSFLSGFIK